MTRQRGYFCSCGAELYRQSKSGLCKRCWNASGKSHRGCYGAHRGRLPADTVTALCWNKNCRAPFACAPWRDPRYSLCPKCLAEYDECNGLPSTEPVYVLAE